jgi:hypothetical protein
LAQGGGGAMTFQHISADSLSFYHADDGTFDFSPRALCNRKSFAEINQSDLNIISICR